ncbi:MAG TPA: 4Fe-4S binding protein, partial [Syntrophales bacterium]|nr:4Fe-4S binding protein [Syntrophales bacterium]
SYGLLPTVPGLFEFPLMRGGGAPVHERLGKLWTKYRKDGLAESFAGNPTPVARVVPIRHAVGDTLHIHPYEEVAKLIERADYIALGQCACRVSARACHAPRDTCLFFDAPARFLVERRYARRIEKEEAKRVLDMSEEAGLVHTSSNTADRASFICNCCPCCCIILTCRTRLYLADGFATSGFQATVESKACSACRLCADERCPVGAIGMKDDCAAVDPGKCIGCGLCATACPTGAMTLVRRSNAPKVPATSRDLAAAVLKEKNKLDRFLKVEGK